MSVGAVPDQSRWGETELIERARALGPALAAQRLETRALRRLPDDIVSALKENRFFKACQPARFGGFELPFGTTMKVAAELARFCGSTGWVASVMGVHHWMTAKFDLEAQEDVWGDDPDAVVASAFRFVRGTVTRVDGGWEVTGKVAFASGIDIADWVIMGTPPLEREHGPPDRAFLLVPKSDYEILDVWHSPGLSGTGTNDIELETVFVPAHRALSFSEIDKVETPGSKVHGAAYRLPLFGPFNYSIAAPAIGMAEGALDAFCETMGVRNDRRTHNRIAENATLQVRTSEASAEIDCARLLFETDVRLMRDAALQGPEPAPADIARFTRNAAYAATLCKRACARLTEAMGAGGLKQDNLVHLAYADIHAASVHIVTVWDMNAQPYGKYLLGVEHPGPLP